MRYVILDTLTAFGILTNLFFFFLSFIVDNRQTQVSATIETSNTTTVDDAFFGDYHDPHNFIKYVLSILDNNVKRWKKQVMYANYTSVIQASGMGKSRMIKQLAESGVYIFYCCLRLSGSGYPLTSYITEHLLSSYDELHFVAYFIACLDKLTETPNIDAINWYHLQIARKGNYTNQENVQAFWQDIISRMEKLKSTFKNVVNVDPTAILRNSYHDVIKTYPNIRDTVTDNDILRICFVFDESRCLLEVGPKINAGNQEKVIGKNNAFNNMRRALIRFDDYANVFTLVMDTVSRLSNFQPTQVVDPSARVEIEGKKLFEPLYLFPTTDVMAVKVNILETTKLEDAVHPSILYRYGRPMWGAHIEKRGHEEMETHLQRLVHLASNKILGGKVIENVEKLDHASALAILAIRISLNVSPLSQLSSELIASHMRVCGFVSDDRMLVTSNYLIEPILAEAAAQLMESIPVHALLDHLLKAVRSGMVEAGFRGELGARIILMKAWDVCKLSTITNRYSSPITIAKFMNALFGIDFAEFVMKQKKQQEIPDDEDGLSSGHLFNQDDVENLADAKIFFTSFVAITYTPTKKDLLQFLLRGTAIICKRNQKGVDFIIPALLKKEGDYFLDENFVSYILLSIKNRKHDDEFAESTTSKLTPTFSEIDENTSKPYLSIYMQLGLEYNSLSLAKEFGIMSSSQRQLAKEVMEGETNAQKKFKTKKGATLKIYRQKHQISLVAIGKSENLYPCLTETDGFGNKDVIRTKELVSCLHELLYAWPDPVEQHDNDEKKKLTKDMFTLIYK